VREQAPAVDAPGADSYDFAERAYPMRLDCDPSYCQDFFCINKLRHVLYEFASGLWPTPLHEI
jgi:hypothetical protein